MGRVLFQSCCYFDQFFFFNSFGYYLLNFKDPFGQGACFVHHHCFYLGHNIQIVSAFEQDSISGSKADTSKVAQRYGNNQCTGTTDHQEYQCTIKPFPKHIIIHKKYWGYTKCQCKEKYDWGIYFGKTGYEELGL